MSEKKLETRLAAIVMGLQGLSILGIWGAYILGSAFKDGIRTVENNMYLGLHLLAEMAMDALLTVRSIGVKLERGWSGLLG